MLADNIYEKASELCGETSDVLEDLCVIAQAELERKLRQGVSSSDCSEEFTLAAALLALAHYKSMGSGIENIESFSAGSVSIKEKDSGELEEQLRREAEIIMAPYIRDDSFVFLGVRG